MGCSNACEVVGCETLSKIDKVCVFFSDEDLVMERQGSLALGLDVLSITGLGEMLLAESCVTQCCSPVN